MSVLPPGLRPRLPLLLALAALVALQAVGRLLGSSAELGAGCLRAVGAAAADLTAPCAGARPDVGSLLLVGSVVAVVLLLTHLGAHVLAGSAVEGARRVGRVVAALRLDVLRLVTAAPRTCVTHRRVLPTDPPPVVRRDVVRPCVSRRGPPVPAA